MLIRKIEKFEGKKASFMSNLKFLQNIFSIYNEKDHKILLIFGLKIKFKNNCKKELKTVKEDLKKINKDLKLLHTILQKSIDITKIPPATGNLRSVQLIKTKILELSIAIFNKYDIPYWLDYGTLIGTIRHKGFIPWDDDIDVCLLKEDYLKLPEIFSKELQNTDFYYTLGDEKGSQLIRLGYKGYVIDFFPFEFINKRCSTQAEKEEFLAKWFMIKAKILKKYPLKEFINNKINHISIINEVNKMKKDLFNKDYNENCQSGQLIRSAETITIAKRIAIVEYEDIFPLSKGVFEGLELSIPKNALNHLYQHNLYGEYGAVMTFPTINSPGFYHTQLLYNDNYDYEEDYSKISGFVETIKMTL